MSARQKRHPRRREEYLVRSVEVRTFEARVSLRIEQPRGVDPEIESAPWLEFMGSLTEPIKGTDQARCSVYPTEKLRIGTAKPASVGAIIGLRDELQVVTSVLPADFDRLWTLALTGHLRYCHLVFTPPRYGRALVTNLSFSNTPEE